MDAISFDFFNELPPSCFSMWMFQETTSVIDALLILISLMISKEIFLRFVTLMVYPRAWVSIVYHLAHSIILASINYFRITKVLENSDMWLFAIWIIYWNSVLYFQNPHHTILYVEARTLQHRKKKDLHPFSHLCHPGSLRSGTNPPMSLIKQGRINHRFL